MTIAVKDDTAIEESWDTLLDELLGFDFVTVDDEEPGRYRLSEVGRRHVTLSATLVDPRPVFTVRDVPAKEQFRFRS